eukprot:3069777-Karenia_brevis.AAC.1
MSSFIPKGCKITPENVIRTVGECKLDSKSKQDHVFLRDVGLQIMSDMYRRKMQERCRGPGFFEESAKAICESVKESGVFRLKNPADFTPDQRFLDKKLLCE